MRWAQAGVVLVLTLAWTGCSGSSAPVVRLYCAQDEEFADQIFADFTGQTGVRVLPSYDTEATKSVQLYETIVREAGRPRADVFWNNEILSTIRLEQQGLLEPYNSPSAADYPASVPHGKDHTWQAFAARARVFVVNTKLVPKASDRPRGLFDLLKPLWKGRIAMAKPQYGTTATQAACLFEVLGPAEARKFYQGLRANGVQIVSGNKQAAESAGNG